MVQSFTRSELSPSDLWMKLLDPNFATQGNLWQERDVALAAQGFPDNRVVVSKIPGSSTWRLFSKNVIGCWSYQSSNTSLHWKKSGFINLWHGFPFSPPPNFPVVSFIFCWIRHGFCWGQELLTQLQRSPWKKLRRTTLDWATGCALGGIFHAWESHWLSNLFRTFLNEREDYFVVLFVTSFIKVVVSPQIWLFQGSYYETWSNKRHWLGQVIRKNSEKLRVGHSIYPHFNYHRKIWRTFLGGAILVFGRVPYIYPYIKVLPECRIVEQTSLITSRLDMKLPR